VAAPSSARYDGWAGVLGGLLRELFEEAGVLLATRADGSLLSFARDDDERRFVEHRRALNAGQRRSSTFAARSGCSSPSSACTTSPTG